VEEVDATKDVDVITDSTGKSGKERKGEKEDFRLATCTWQGLEGRQHQAKGRRINDRLTPAPAFISPWVQRVRVWILTYISKVI
jgi:hypothetical protein